MYLASENELWAPRHVVRERAGDHPEVSRELRAGIHLLWGLPDYFSHGAVNHVVYVAGSKLDSGGDR